ncbi:MarR family winged helix-turn-helix transcriptional regulator [Streptomyces sp. NPDC057557]|uniref:MarR family winged helix-turn-helix transcriptional regulator n=1 Tax=Streptomyces sp. NPDC057557 TaxID=3346167 RepID=UPI003686B97E
MSKDVRVDDISMQLRLLQQSFDAFDEAVATRLGLNRTDLRCLDVVLGSGPLSAGEISTAVKLSPAATTTAIDRLSRAGYVSRTRDDDNRRRVLVTATDAGRTVEAEIFRPVGQAGAQALSHYDEDQLAVILDFLQTARRVQHAQITRLTMTTTLPG